MSMRSCRECGKSISSKAERCPHCGAKRKGLSVFTWSLLIISGLVLYSFYNKPDLSAQDNSEGKWEVWPIHEDALDGSKGFYVGSPEVESLKPMTRPYQNVDSQIVVGCDEESEWAYIFFSKSPNIGENSHLGSLESFTVKANWGGAVEEIKAVHKPGSKVIMFVDNDSIISKLKANSRVKFEVDWYGQNYPVFDYSLAGSSSAINSIFEKCKTI